MIEILSELLNILWPIRVVDWEFWFLYTLDYVELIFFYFSQKTNWTESLAIYLTHRKVIFYNTVYSTISLYITVNKKYNNHWRYACLVVENGVNHHATKRNKVIWIWFFPSIWRYRILKKRRKPRTRLNDPGNITQRQKYCYICFLPAFQRTANCTTGLPA